jgi:type IV pilus assembly protein PilC
MPRFTKMYAEFDADLPYPTQVLMSVVEHSDVIFPATVILSLILYAVAKYWFTRRDGKVWLDKIMLSAPLIRNVTIPFNISSNTSALATLLSAGMPLVDALKATAKSSSNAYIAEKLRHASQKIAEGHGFADTLKEYEIVDDSALTMIRAGEKSGRLTSILREVSGFNSEKLDNAISRHLALIEPMIMLVMGLVLGGVIFVMYLPIFTIAEVIK